MKYGSKERMLASSCTEVTARLDKEVARPLPRGHRYFGCRVEFNQDGGATAVMAWRRSATFEDAVTIERIRWDDDREAGVSSQGRRAGVQAP